MTLLASQPSLSMFTLTTQRMRSPASPGSPTVETIFRSSSAASFRVAFGSSLSAAARSSESMRRGDLRPLAIPEFRKTRLVPCRNASSLSASFSVSSEFRRRHLPHLGLSASMSSSPDIAR